MRVEPYLDFNGQCDEAIEFYKKTLGAEVLMLMRFKDAPPATSGGCQMTPGTENKVMHASLRVGETTVMASDGRCTGKTNFAGISLSLGASNDAQAAKLFAGLSDGGKVCVPLSKTFFASSFGMVSDKFGVMWMVIAGSQGPK